MPRKVRPTEDRFWEKVNKNTESGCWEWTSALVRGGYGGFATHFPSEGRKNNRAHRFAWTLVNGQIPDGLWVLHKCDNRICVNPDHLFLGDSKDNMLDCAAKGRVCTIARSNQTHCKHGHELSGDNLRIDKHGHRVCITCYRGYGKKKWDKYKDEINKIRREKYAASIRSIKELP